MRALILAVIAVVALAAVQAVPTNLNLTSPDVDLDTKFYVFYDAALGRNVTTYEVIRINSALAWGLQGDNAASPAGEVGFIVSQYGQNTGYILRYCVEMVMPEGVGEHELDHGNTDAFAPYECCNGGGCMPCGYTGSGTNGNPAMVGRSYGYDLPPFATAAGMTTSRDFGWWYSFNNAGYCAPSQDLLTNNCTYKQSPFVDVVTLQDVMAQPGWTSNPANMSQFQTINNMVVNAYNSSLSSSFIYHPTKNAYVAMNGQFRADPAQRCAIACALGTYSATGRLETFSAKGGCAQCPTGTYADQLGSTSCTPCPTGTTTNGAGASSIANCFAPSTAACLPGTFNNETGHAPCTPCPAGTYATKTAAEGCVACPMYTTSTAVGAASVSTCALNPPQASTVFSYGTSASNAADIASQPTVAIGVNATIGMLQTNNFGLAISPSGYLWKGCVESVNVSFYSNNYCWGTYCSYTSDLLNLPIGGVSQAYAAPDPSDNGNWALFPPAGECTNAQLPGQGGCTWKQSAIGYTVSIADLMAAGLYSCQALDPTGFSCGSQYTQEQWDNSTFVLHNLAKIATLTSTVSLTGNDTYGPVVNVNGKCVVQCPAGYQARSAFTAPHCVPIANSTTASLLFGSSTAPTTYNASALLAADDAEAVVFEEASPGASGIVIASVMVIAVVASVAAVMTYRIKRRRSGFQAFL